MLDEGGKELFENLKLNKSLRRINFKKIAKKFLPKIK